MSQTGRTGCHEQTGKGDQVQGLMAHVRQRDHRLARSLPRHGGRSIDAAAIRARTHPGAAPDTGIRHGDSQSQSRRHPDGDRTACAPSYGQAAPLHPPRPQAADDAGAPRRRRATTADRRPGSMGPPVGPSGERPTETRRLGARDSASGRAARGDQRGTVRRPRVSRSRGPRTGAHDRLLPARCTSIKRTRLRHTSTRGTRSPHARWTGTHRTT